MNACEACAGNVAPGKVCYACGLRGAGELAPAPSSEARHSCRLVQTAENLQAACSLFCVGSPSAAPIYLLVLEAPPLGGSGHPVAFPVVGHDAFERASELFDGFAARYIKGGRP